jgi:NADH dehydrogenase FAD-containing subunit
MMQNAQFHQVVIIGGGFGGLYAAQALRRAPVRATLVDKRNFHLFQLLLYQVATGSLSPGDIAYPLRSVFAHDDNLAVIMAEVIAIDVPHRGQRLREKDLRPFRYHHKGNLAIIGRHAGVADFGRLHLHDFLAWILWLFVHISYLIGFDNKLLVLFQWAWNYVTCKRGAQLITGKDG